MDKENATKCKAERRSSKRIAKPKLQEIGAKRKIIGVSDYPKPYKASDSTDKSCSKTYLTTDWKREHSVER